MGRRTAASEPPHCQHTNLSAFGFTFPASVNDRIAMRWRLPAQAISTSSAGAKLTQPAKQWYGQVKFGPVAPSTKRRTQHMEYLYAKQKGMDALCKVPLPPLYVGPPWKRRLNPAIEIDHKFPTAKGGTDARSNLQLTLQEYNRKKGVLTGYQLRSAKQCFCPV